MTSLLQSRTIAEHLSTLASLLEAEAIRANTLGIKTHKDIAYKAYQVRHLADQLWKAITEFDVEYLPPKKSAKPKRESMLSLVTRQG
jgi:hypothetical protein